MPSANNQTPGYAVRRAALDILTEHNRSGRFIKELISEFCTGLTDQDKSLTREIASGTIRWKALLDYNINQYVPEKIKDSALQNILRLTAYQILFLDSIPGYAAVNTGVELTKKTPGRQKSNFANAVLRKILSAGLLKEKQETIKALSINTSYPVWLVKRWNIEIGPSGLKKALDAGNNFGGFWFRVNTEKISIEEARLEIEKLGVEIYILQDTPFFRIKDDMGRLLNSNPFQNGKLAIQDPAAWYICAMLEPKKGDLILDMCSAPGSKSALLSEMSSGNAEIVSADISQHRMRKISDTFGRLGHRGIFPLIMDGIVPAVRKKFNKALIDAPCSNQGVIAGKPEVKWRITQNKINALVKIQSSLLNSAASLVLPGGVMVYSTCSPDKSETENVITDFLRKHNAWTLESAENYIPGNMVKNKCLRIFPGETEFGGFFAARLVRKFE